MQREHSQKFVTLRRIALCSLALVVLTLCGACGQKGDLYLPPEETQQ